MTCSYTARPDTMNCARHGTMRLIYTAICVLLVPLLAGAGDLDIVDANMGRTTSATNGETFLHPQLTVRPGRKTMLAGESVLLKVGNSASNITWFLIENPSGGTITPMTSTSAVYEAGVTSSVIDIVEAWDGDNGFGRAYFNIISEADVAAAGKAIVIAGRKGTGDSLWPATDYLADVGYNALLYRGFSKANVQYLNCVTNQDADGNGAFDDIDLETTKANTALTFTNWANNSDKLFVYLVDHGADPGSNGVFYLNASDTLTASELDTWLDDLQNTYTTEVTVVIDCCHAGSFVDELTYTGTAKRIVIASCAGGEPSYFVAGGLVSFSDAFFSGVALGLDIGSSFEQAQAAMDTYQTAWIDDNGDGVYQDGVDGAYASTVYLGATFVAGKDIPQIGLVLGNQLLRDTTTATMWADDVVSAYEIQRVWCLIVPPGHNPDPDDPVSDLPELDLTYNQTIGRYEAQYDGFSEEGSYKVIFYAMDVWGSVSLPRQSYVTQSSFDERAIIVAGGSTNDPDWASVNNIGNMAYHILKSRWFTSNTIQYLNGNVDQDIDFDGTNDVDALPTLANLAWAITNWAGTTNFGGPADKLTIYLVGAATNSDFRMNASEALTAASLDGWVDTFQASNREVIIVMDFSGCGGFLPSLTPPPERERICVASTKSGKSACIAENGYCSFSQCFLSEVFRGRNIGDAFLAAKQTIKPLSGTRQRALLDDDGDGTPNEPGQDLLCALNSYIGTAFMTGADSPMIDQVTPDTLLKGTNTLLLWASGVTDMDGISNVWCVITPPNCSGPGDLVRTNLAWNSGTERYEALYTNFLSGGVYACTFYAMDDLGEISSPVQCEVIRGDAYEVDDTSGAASMFNVGVPQLHNFHSDSDLDWVKFFVPTGQIFDIEAEQLGSNVLLGIELYYEEANGSLTSIDFDETFLAGPGQTAATYVDTDTENDPGYYYVRVYSTDTNYWGFDSDYELRVFSTAAGEGLLVIAVNGITTGPLPAGPQIKVGTNTYAFGSDGISRMLTDQTSGVVSVSITNMPAGWFAAESTNLAGQVQNPNNQVFGVPRSVDLDLATFQTTLFVFAPLLTAQGTVRDQWTGRRIGGASVKFTARSGRVAGLDYDRYPDDAVYATPWLTLVNGEFPTNVLLPTVDWDMTLSVAGYPNTVFSNAIPATNAGAVVNLGTMFLTPTDANTNQIGDHWEDSCFGFSFSADPSGDDDGDGLSNRDEYRLGTDPKDKDSKLGADIEPEVVTNGVKITWPVVAGRYYRLRHRSGLTSNTWSEIAGPWEAATGQTNMSHTVVTNATRGYYRIQAFRP